MYKQLIYLISFVLVLSLVGHVQAQTANWTDGDPDNHLWSSPENWDEYPSDISYWAKIVNGEVGATLDSEAVCLKMHVGGDLTFTVMDGAILTMPQDLVIARSGVGTFDMMGGTVNIGRDFEFGFDNTANCNMTGGTIIVTRDVEMPKTGNEQTVHMALHGGTFIINRNLLMREGATLDITAGTMILDGDAVAVVQGYVDNGWISAYEGDGRIERDYDVTNAGRTTVTAIHKFNPIPADGGIAAPGTTTLEWTVDAGTLVDVWFGTSPDWTTWEQLIAKQAATSVSVTTEAKQYYFWAVDTYAPGAEDPNYGPIFSFLADNIAPIVDAGEDVMTWLDLGVEVPLAGTVLDVDPTTTLWTVVSEPNDPNNPDAVIADPTALNTTITLSALGEYVLQLDANDGEYDAEPDQITISFFSDHCAAAQSQPGWQPLIGDINLDCVVDQADLDILLERWLNCNALDCPDIGPIDPNVP
jgi:hypothetical protein